MPTRKAHQPATQRLQMITAAKVAHRHASASRLAVGETPQQDPRVSFVVTSVEPKKLRSLAAGYGPLGTCPEYLSSTAWAGGE